MAIGMLLAGEAITQDSYTGLTKKMFGSYPMPEDQSPEGLMLHTAGQSDQGWYVYDVWESKEHFQRFAQNKLGPAIKELGAGSDSQLQPQFFPVETLVKGPAL